MSTPRDIRRLAFQILYQLDAREAGSGSPEASAVLESLDAPESYSDRDRVRAYELATAAYSSRAAADAEMEVLAPTWPAHRQAAVDRALLRLAHYEMTGTDTPPKAVVNEAVELAKVFSTEKSPGFINALLDKVLKRVLAEQSPAEQS